MSPAVDGRRGESRRSSWARAWANGLVFCVVLVESSSKMNDDGSLMRAMVEPEKMLSSLRALSH